MARRSEGVWELPGEGSNNVFLRVGNDLRGVFLDDAVRWDSVSIFNLFHQAAVWKFVLKELSSAFVTLTDSRSCDDSEALLVFGV